MGKPLKVKRVDASGRRVVQSTMLLDLKTWRKLLRLAQAEAEDLGVHPSQSRTIRVLIEHAMATGEPIPLGAPMTAPMPDGESPNRGARR
jgi:hypothetical protein